MEKLDSVSSSVSLKMLLFGSWIFPVLISSLILDNFNGYSIIPSDNHVSGIEIKGNNKWKTIIENASKI